MIKHHLKRITRRCSHSEVTTYRNLYIPKEDYISITSFCPGEDAQSIYFIGLSLLSKGLYASKLQKMATKEERFQKLIEEHELASFRIAEHLLNARNNSNYEYHPDQISFCGVNMYRPDLENAFENMIESSFEEHKSEKRPARFIFFRKHMSRKGWKNLIAGTILGLALGAGAAYASIKYIPSLYERAKE